MCIILLKHIFLHVFFILLCFFTCIASFIPTNLRNLNLQNPNQYFFNIMLRKVLPKLFYLINIAINLIALLTILITTKINIFIFVKIHIIFIYYLIRLNLIFTSIISNLILLIYQINLRLFT